MNIDTERLCNVLRENMRYLPETNPLHRKAQTTAIALIGTMAETVASVEALVKDFGGDSNETPDLRWFDLDRRYNNYWQKRGADSGNAASGSAIPTGAEEDKRAPTARPKPPAAPHPDNWVREVGKVSETERHAVRAGWMEG